jgi:hypothetical protein
MWSQNTPRKNSRNASNISMKKYHQRPGFGVKSGSVSGVMKTAGTKFHDGRNKRERPKIMAEIDPNTMMRMSRNGTIGG